MPASGFNRAGVTVFCPDWIKAPMNEAPQRTVASINHVAREAIRALAANQLPATPTNYAQAFRRAESGQPSALAPIITAYEAIERAADLIPDKALASKLKRAIQGDDWHAVQSALGKALEKPTTQLDQVSAAEPVALMQRVLQQLEVHHAGITLTKKREGLKRALAPRNETFGEMQRRLQRLLESWAAGPVDGAAHVVSGIGEQAPLPMPAAPAPSLPPPPAQSFGRASEIFAAAKNLVPGNTSADSRSKRAALCVEDPLVSRLSALLQMLLQNLVALTPESSFLKVQVDLIERVMSPPLTEHKLDEAERALRNLVIRQGTITHGIEEARDAAKGLASSLIERLSTMSASANIYTGKVNQVVAKIGRAENLTQLSHVVTGLLADTQLMSADMVRARDDLHEARARARDLETRTKSLESELAIASTLVRTDPLTAALNRRGLEEAFSQHVVSPARSLESCIALLDIDDFKGINEAFGHLVGDSALKQLIEVVRDFTRDKDSVGRYGGEEFVILFPDTTRDTAYDIMVRIQRELTKRVFLEDHSRVFMTFSCGLTRVLTGENLESALLRADGALHDAKRAGKNRVICCAD
jgi:diguanylate cyclase